MLTIPTFVNRRLRLMEEMQRGVAAIHTAPEQIRNRDSHFPYRFDSHFYYLTGFTEPDAVLVLVAGDNPQSLLFCREKDLEREIWDGFRYGPEAAQQHFGFDAAYPINELDERMTVLLADQPALFYPLGSSGNWDSRIMGWVNGVREKSRSGISAPSVLQDISVLIDEARLFKQPEEIQLMRRAAEISTGAHRRAMQHTRPGMPEYAIEAELLHEFRRHGAQSPAYTSIVAGGANACVLHYIANNAPLHDGDLLLIDAGCEFDGYAADITRTFPVNGKFSAPQKDIYEMVLAAQVAAIAAATPGNHWNAPHEAALNVLVRGMIDFKLCHGSVESVIESGDYRRFYMHRTGHWLGLDVHDVGEYKQNSEWRALQPGMALTVEPGCYIRPGDDVPEAYWNIGIRIEDDVLITDQGNDVLTFAAPKTVSDIENLMRDHAA